MKKSIFLFFAAILCAMSINAAIVTSDGTARLYFNKEAMDWWDSDGAKLSAYFYNSSTNKFAGIAKQHSGNTYYVVIPKGSWTNVILTRHNNTTTTPSWDNKWNQTGNLTLSSTSNYISKFEKDKTTTTWGTAVKPASNAAVSAAASTIFVGASTTLTPSLTSNSSINDIKSTAYTISPTTGASISGNTFTASAEDTYTITATITYHPDGYPSLTSTATATTDITVTVPAEEVHDVTVSYMCGSTEIADETKISSVGVETEGDAVAPAKIKGYNFVNWTIGDGVINQTGDNTAREIKINTKSTGTYTLIANYEPETVYFVNTDEWAVVNVYAWVEDGIKNGEWPGEELTPTGEKIGGYDVYRYTSGEGYENVIFNDKVGSNASKQTPDLVWTNGKYYVYNGQTSVDADDWYAKVDVEGALPDWFATNVYLVGSMFANWDKTPDKEFRKATKDATTANIVVNLDANKEYELKVRRGDDWTSYTSKITNTVTGLQFSSSNNDNCKMKTTVAGDYTFTWTISSSKLDVKYPTLYAVTATANDAAMGTVAGAGNYGKGSTATLTATPNDGYLFVNWTKGGEVVANTQEYSFEVTEAVELVANFEAAAEEVHNVTVSYVCGGNKIAEDQTVAAVGVTTPKTAEAPAIFGYTFTSWTLGAGVTSSNTTANPISINTVASGSDFTLTANYTEIPKVTIYFVNNKKWSKVYAYGWGGSVGENPAWPGQEITANKEAEQIAGFDVHSYSVVPGSYVNIKFTNNSGTESANFKWTDGKYYYMDAANDYVGGTKEEVTKELTPTYTVAGDSEAAFGTTWDPTNTANDMALEGGLYKWTKTNVALYANTKISFKVVKNHDWNKGQWPERDGENDNNWILQDGITADGLYTITITFNESTKEIQATATKTGDIVIKDFSNQPATLYFHPSFHWTSDAAHFAAYFYNNGPGADAEPTWANMTDSDGDGVYEVANAKQHEYVIICRMNPSRTENKWDDDVMWNQIESGITIPNTAGDLNTCLAFWTNCQGDVSTSECTWVAPTPLTDSNWADFVTDYADKTINAVVERSFKSGQYHTLCLPFDIPTDWLGEGTEAYQLTSIAANNTGDKLSLNATLWNTIEAGQPYIIVPVKGSEYEHIIINGVTVKNVSAGTNVASGDGYKATLKAVTATDGTQTNGSTEYYVGANDGKLYNAQTDKLGLRAIIELTTTGGQPLPAKVRAYVAAEENEATGFENIVAPEGQAMRVIENGQLIIIRGNEKFNAQGIKL